MSAPPEIETERRASCLLCGWAGVPLYDDLEDRLYDTPGRYGLQRCAACGLVWLSPRPSVRALPKCYPESYEAHVPARAGESAPRPGGGLRDELRALILGHALGYPAFLRMWPGARLLGRALGTIPLLRGRATFGWHELCPPFVRGGRLLDVGCGAGTHLARMRDLGWEVMGVDPSPQAAEVARRRYGVAVRPGTLEDAKFTDQTFAVVTMTHAIEHVPDPIATLAECRRILRPGGRVVLTTPNLAGLMSVLFGRDWVGLDPPRHLHLFTPATLRACLARAGFRVLRVRSRSYQAPIEFELSRRIRRAGEARGRLTGDGPGWPASALGTLERAMLPVWPWAGNELMACAVRER